MAGRRVRKGQHLHCWLRQAQWSCSAGCLGNPGENSKTFQHPVNNGTDASFTPAPSALQIIVYIRFLNFSVHPAVIIGKIFINFFLFPRSPFILGSKDNIIVKYIIRNEGENAYLPQINITSSNNMPFTRIPSACSLLRVATLQCNLNDYRPLGNMQTVGHYNSIKMTRLNYCIFKGIHRNQLRQFEFTRYKSRYPRASIQCWKRI